MKYVIVCGNPRDGFKFTGPFEAQGDAIDYADAHLLNEKDWWVCEVSPPEENNHTT